MGNTQMSMLEKACELMEKKRTSQPISKIIEEVLESKGLDDPEGDLATQLYIDITTSSKFVYMGKDEWDLKSRQSLDEWDKDGASFNSGEELEDEDDGLTVKDYELEDTETDEDEESKSETDEEDTDVDDREVEEDDHDVTTDDTEVEHEEDVVESYDEDDIDEDSYNDIMDEYEDMYDDK